MKMRKRARAACVVAVTAGVAAVGAAWGATAQELRALLDKGSAVAVVDVRPSSAFAQGHIPGALNIPLAVLPQKALPSLGRVVVCGDGLRAGDVAAAVAALNAKAGIRAEALDGGLPAWEAAGRVTTRGAGLERERTTYLTYEELLAEAARNPDLSLVDLRRGAPGLTDLDRLFPKNARLRSQGDAAAPPPSRPGSGQRVYVLIDDGDGRAEALAHRWKGAGAGSTAILAGGETALRTAGKASNLTIERSQ